MECCVLRLGCSLNSNSNWTELNWTKLNNSFKCQRWSRLVLSMHAQVEQLLLWFCQKAEATFSRDCTEECCQNAQITKPELHSSRRWGTECARLQLAIFDCAIYMWKKKSAQNGVRTCSSVVKCIAEISIFQSIKLRYFKPMIFSNFQRCNLITKTLMKSSMKIAYK